MRATRLGITAWRIAVAVIFIGISAPLTIATSSWSMVAVAASLGALIVARGLYHPEEECEQVMLAADTNGLTFDPLAIAASRIRRARVMPREGHADIDIDRGALI